MGTILYTLNTTGALTRSENKSNPAIENYRTEYEYDTHHRLTKGTHLTSWMSMFTMMQVAS